MNMKMCPVCNRELIEVVRYGVEIDVCPKCKGVWLDGGEFEKIIKKIREELMEVERAVPEYREFYIKKKKKKPIFFEFFEEIFD